MARELPGHAAAACLRATPTSPLHWLRNFLVESHQMHFCSRHRLFFMDSYFVSKQMFEHEMMEMKRSKGQGENLPILSVNFDRKLHCLISLKLSINLEPVIYIKK
jgi:hypothetical protein